MIQLVRRARAYQPLSPAERAFLRLLEALAYVALLGGATAAAQYFAGPAGAGGAINWATVGRVCAAGAALAVVMALAKYFKAHGDPALAGALTALATPLTAASQPAPPSSAPDPAPDPAPDAAAPAPPRANDPAPRTTIPLPRVGGGVHLWLRLPTAVGRG